MILDSSYFLPILQKMEKYIVDSMLYILILMKMLQLLQKSIIEDGKLKNALEYEFGI